MLFDTNVPHTATDDPVYDVCSPMLYSLNRTITQSSWDVAAGSILIEEAGGAMTDLRNERWKVTQLVHVYLGTQSMKVQTHNCNCLPPKFRSPPPESTGLLCPVIAE